MNPSSLRHLCASRRMTRSIARVLYTCAIGACVLSMEQTALAQAQACQEGQPNQPPLTSPPCAPPAAAPSNPAHYSGGSGYPSGVYGNITLVPVLWTNQVAADVQANIVTTLSSFLAPAAPNGDPSGPSICSELSEYDEASPSANQPLERGGTVTATALINPKQTPTCSGVRCEMQLVEPVRRKCGQLRVDRSSGQHGAEQPDGGRDDPEGGFGR